MAKAGDTYVPGVYIEEFLDPDSDIIRKKDYSNDILRRITDIEGAPITEGWLLKNDFKTIDLYEDSTFELFQMLNRTFGELTKPTDEDTLLFLTSIQDEYGEYHDIVILYNYDTHRTHIVEYKTTITLDKDDYSDIHEHTIHKVYTGILHDIHELQNILTDMDIHIRFLK